MYIHTVYTCIYTLYIHVYVYIMYVCCPLKLVTLFRSIPIKIKHSFVISYLFALYSGTCTCMFIVLKLFGGLEEYV